MPEASNPEVDFDVQKDISPERWREIEAELAKSLEDTTPPDGRYFALGLASNAKLLDPKRVPDFPESQWDFITEGIAEDRRNDRWAAVLSAAYAAKLVDPKRDLGLTTQDWNKFARVLSENRREKNWWQYLYAAIEIKVLEPRREFSITDSEREQIEVHIHEHRQKDSDPRDYFKEIAMARVLGLDIKPQAVDWKRIKAFSKGDWDISNYLFMMVSMKWAAAESIRIKENGIEVNMSKASDEGLPRSLPEPLSI